VIGAKKKKNGEALICSQQVRKHNLICMIPNNRLLVPGKTFCEQAKALLPQARVVCVNLRPGP
jgi:hypothetical protein